MASRGQSFELLAGFEQNMDFGRDHLQFRQKQKERTMFLLRASEEEGGDGVDIGPWELRLPAGRNGFVDVL
jgi:hypothetical protein